MSTPPPSPPALTRNAYLFSRGIMGTRLARTEGDLRAMSEQVAVDKTALEKQISLQEVSGRKLKSSRRVFVVVIVVVIVVIGVGGGGGVGVGSGVGGVGGGGGVGVGVGVGVNS